MSNHTSRFLVPDKLFRLKNLAMSHPENLSFRLRDRAKTSSQLRLDGVVPFGQSFMALQSK